MYFKSIESESISSTLQELLTSEQVSTIDQDSKNSKYSQPTIWSVAWGKEYTIQEHRTKSTKLR